MKPKCLQILEVTFGLLIFLFTSHSKELTDWNSIETVLCVKVISESNLVYGNERHQNTHKKAHCFCRSAPLQIFDMEIYLIPLGHTGFTSVNVFQNGFHKCLFGIPRHTNNGEYQGILWISLNDRDLGYFRRLKGMNFNLGRWKKPFPCPFI